MGVLAAALAALEVDRVLLAIPDRSFPGDPDDDTGAGAPDSAAGRRFLEHVRALGFTGVQLGPQGETSPGDPSPYDGTLFSRGRLALAVGRLAEPEWGALLDRDAVARLVAGRPATEPGRVAYRYALEANAAALTASYDAFAARRAAGDPAVADVADRLAVFEHEAADWLERDALYAVLRDAHAGASWRDWPERVDRMLWHPGDGAEPRHAARRRELLARARDACARYAFSQLVLHEQHRTVRAHAHALGLELWGDLQIGFSDRDAWSWQALFLDGYRLGAPPSRTNPPGQPWGYPVLDPGCADAMVRFFTRRLHKTFAEYDGVRVDHPHGLVCPWVYRDGGGDAEAAVRAGARLFAAPALADHPALARFAIPRPDQMNPDARTPRYADDWVVTLEPAQVARYSRLFDIVLEAARRHGRDARALACEVLSTCPYPLARVLETHGLGRMRVTQKVDLADPDDVYRSENAAAADWLMVGTHDTPPIWTVVARWRDAGTLGERAAYLAARLAPDPRGRDAFAARLAASPGLLVQALFADLFASRARQVSVFFTDAFGLREPYNQPGTVGEPNWTLRLAPDHAARHRALLRVDAALNLPLALAMALRAGGARTSETHAALARRLDLEAERWRRGDLPA